MPFDSKSIKPYKRGELEISSLNEEYFKKGILNVKILGRCFAWLDTGIHDSLLEASNYIHNVEKRSGLKAACLEGIAYNMGYIGADQLKILNELLMKAGYGKYLKNKVF